MHSNFYYYFSTILFSWLQWTRAIVCFFPEICEWEAKLLALEFSQDIKPIREVMPKSRQSGAFSAHPWLRKGASVATMLGQCFQTDPGPQPTLPQPWPQLFPVHRPHSPTLDVSLLLLEI